MISMAFINIKHHLFKKSTSKWWFFSVFVNFALWRCLLKNNIVVFAKSSFFPYETSSSLIVALRFGFDCLRSAGWGDCWVRLSASEPRL